MGEINGRGIESGPLPEETPTESDVTETYERRPFNRKGNVYSNADLCLICHAQLCSLLMCLNKSRRFLFLCRRQRGCRICLS